CALPISGLHVRNATRGAADRVRHEHANPSARIFRMLAGIEEPVHSRKPFAVTAVKTATKTAIDALLEGLIDYAGLYPPASLNMRPAVENYRRYRREKNSNALGRFI